MNVSFNGSDSSEYLQKLNYLIKAVESTLKECNRKYKNKEEIDNLYTSLHVKLNKFLYDFFVNEAKLEIFEQGKSK